MKAKLESTSGAVLVFALLVLVVGATVLGGIAQLAVTQSVGGQAEWESAARRIQLENSRAMARQYIMSQMWRGFGELPTASLATNAAAGLGSFAITNVEPPFGYWLSLEQAGTKRVNPFGLFERGGFQSGWASGSLGTGSGSAPWGFQIRTRSPITAGFAFVNHRAASNAWAPSRRINMQQADYAVGFTNLPRMPVGSVTNTNTGDLTGFLGFLMLPKAEAGFRDIYDSIDGVETNLVGGDAVIEIDLDIFTHGSPTDDLPRFYEVPKAVDIVAGGSTNYAARVTQLILYNSAGNGTPARPYPLQIVIPAGNTNTVMVTLQGNNARPVYLYRQGATANNFVIATGGGNLQWRIGMTLDCDANFDVSGQLQITGGIRTGRSLTQGSANAPVFVSETAADWKYDAIADRMMWLEDQRAR